MAHWAQLANYITSQSVGSWEGRGYFAAVTENKTVSVRVHENTLWPGEELCLQCGRSEQSVYYKVCRAMLVAAGVSNNFTLLHHLSRKRKKGMCWNTMSDSRSVAPTTTTVKPEELDTAVRIHLTDATCSQERQVWWNDKAVVSLRIKILQPTCSVPSRIILMQVNICRAKEIEWLTATIIFLKNKIVVH